MRECLYIKFWLHKSIKKDEKTYHRRICRICLETCLLDRGIYYKQNNRELVSSNAESYIPFCCIYICSYFGLKDITSMIWSHMCSRV